MIKLFTHNARLLFTASASNISLTQKRTIQFKNYLLGGLIGLLVLAQATSVAAENPKATIETNLGNIVIELFPEQAPLTVENFLAYVNDGFYNGTIFHRVINGFMIQGGGYTKDFYEDQNKTKITRKPVKNESDNGLTNAVGTLAMARTRDPDSATAQFFINVVDNARLDGRPNQPGYTVFGKVVEGLDVVMKIAEAPTRRLGPTPDVPEEPKVMIKVSVN